MRNTSIQHILRRFGLVLMLTAFAGLFSVRAHAQLTVGYSDWPGWVAWEVAIEKDWFSEAGVDVTFEWFDYVASMDAFAAGQLDAVQMMLSWSMFLPTKRHRYWHPETYLPSLPGSRIQVRHCRWWRAQSRCIPLQTSPV